MVNVSKKMDSFSKYGVVIDEDDILLVYTFTLYDCLQACVESAILCFVLRSLVNYR